MAKNILSDKRREYAIDGCAYVVRYVGDDFLPDRRRWDCGIVIDGQFMREAYVDLEKTCGIDEAAKRLLGV